MSGTPREASPLPYPIGDFWLPATVVIESVRPEVEHVNTYFLRFADEVRGAAYEFQPGQFNMLYLPGNGEAAISLSGQDPHSGALLHTIRAVGNVTHALADLEPGETIGLRGPFGNGWPIASLRGRDMLIVAGGIGLAPLRPLINHIVMHRQLYGRARIFYGAREPALMLYASEYRAWRQADIELAATVDRAPPDWTGNVGTVTLLVEQAIDLDPEQTVVCCCGPEVMMHYVARAAMARGIAGHHIWVALERNMQCAAGICGHCLLGPEFVCRDGPVLNYSRVARWLKVEGL